MTQASSATVDRQVPARLRSGFRARPAWSALVSAALFGTVAVTLFSRVPDLRDSDLAPELAQWAPTPIALERSGTDPRVQRLYLFASDPAAVLRRQEIVILFGTYGPTVRLTQGTLTMGRCIYATPAGEKVENNKPVRFARTAGCGDGDTVTGDMMLTMYVPDGLPLAAWTYTPGASAAGGGLIFAGAKPDGRAPVPVLRGRYVDTRTPSRVRRIHLLAYLWQISGRPYWIAVLLAVAAALVALGAAGFPPRSASDPRPLVRAAAAGALALGLGLSYAVLVPPFQAPDEPDHFLAFAQLNGRPDLERGAADWARLGHFERIKSRALERFRPADVGHPYPSAWDPHIFAVPIEGRSRTTQLAWEAVGRLTRGFGAPATLLTIRLVNAVVFGFAVAAAAAILGLSGAPMAPVLVFLFVPTLPFFAAHVSEFAMLTSTYVVFASIVAALFVDAPRTTWLGLPLGLTCTLMLAGGRSAAPMLAVVGAVLAGRVLIGDSPATAETAHAKPFVRPALFWLGATLGASLLLALSTPQFRQGVFPGDASQAGGWVRSGALAVRDRPWMLLVIFPACLLAELAIGYARRKAVPRPALLTAMRIGFTGAAVALAALAVLSVFRQMPTLPLFDYQERPPLRPYLIRALKVGATSFRLRGPDYLLATTFWGGFGWLDTLLPPSVVIGLTAASGAALIWLLVRLAFRGEARRGAWLVVLTGGWLAAFIAYVASSHYIFRNVHGRYVVGLYLSLLAVIWTVPFLRDPVQTNGPDGKVSRFAGPLLLASSAAVHAYSLSFILQRYF